MKVYGRDIRIDAATVSFADKTLSEREVIFSLLECLNEISNSYESHDHSETPSPTKSVKES